MLSSFKIAYLLRDQTHPHPYPYSLRNGCIYIYVYCPTYYRIQNREATEMANDSERGKWRLYIQWNKK